MNKKAHPPLWKRGVIQRGGEQCFHHAGAISRRPMKCQRMWQWTLADNLVPRSNCQLKPALGRHELKKGDAMPKYLVQGSYTDQGLGGLLKEGGSKRRAMVEQLAAEMGGKLEVFYFAFGSDDFVIILDLPSNIDMAATAIVAQASGMVKSRVTILMAPEDVDEAVKRKVDFHPPT
ncbi:GYD domain-containing protein [Mesorhizobium sp. CN2-181]|uniref:GYD domain-containing protein n=1 Tax=Mesorhizobium yinganensis TaxID=3157707 RepID=UPI0032B736EB